MGTVRYTREQIEQKLSKKYLGKVIIFTTIHKREVCGKVARITCETALHNEPMAIFIINHARYECDVNYLLENSIICKGSG